MLPDWSLFAKRTPKLRNQKSQKKPETTKTKKPQTKKPKNEVVWPEPRTAPRAWDVVKVNLALKDLVTWQDGLCKLVAPFIL